MTVQTSLPKLESLVTLRSYLLWTLQRMLWHKQPSHQRITKYRCMLLAHNWSTQSSHPCKIALKHLVKSHITTQLCLWLVTQRSFQFYLQQLTTLLQCRRNAKRALQISQAPRAKTSSSRLKSCEQQLTSVFWIDCSQQHQVLQVVARPSLKLESLEIANS